MFLNPSTNLEQYCISVEVPAMQLFYGNSCMQVVMQTTGMDPVTRRHVWDIIEASKRGRAIVLTTHSMEEADILGDRVAIMARGKLRCIGTPIHLKTRFGAGYLVNVSVRAEDGVLQAGEEAREELRRQKVKHFFAEVCSFVNLLGSLQLRASNMQRNHLYQEYPINI